MRNFFYSNSNGSQNYGNKQSVLDNFGKEVSKSRDAVSQRAKQQKEGAFAEPQEEKEKDC